MKWEKLGLVFVPSNHYPWMATHAANPVAKHLKDSYYKIYFSCRNEMNESSIGWVIIDVKNPNSVLEISDKPILSPGKRGRFDDSGVTISCIVEGNSGEDFLYYLGWNLGIKTPWRNSIGLAKGKDSVFEKYSTAPIIDRNTIDPYTISYIHVLKQNEKFRMWYGSCLDWGDKLEDMHYVIKYAESYDGINWDRRGVICIDEDTDANYAFARPWVMVSDGLYRMWYSYRGRKYRIGYAESYDGIDWTRKDKEAGITVSVKGWDSDEVCYPSVFSHSGEDYILYCGNGYGKTGFGIAVWVK
jgi:predicted GH43/DUF377 family glycosyl hydrolase